MIPILIGCASVLLLCIVSNKLLYRLGIPTLLIFLVLGMLCGSDGIGKIYFDNYDLANNMCSIGLIFIMFYGGFSTNWKAARPVAAKAIALSTLGVVLTAAFTGLFCHFVLRMPMLESFLIGSVVSSTDAASVFSILRSRRLNLKDNLASLLEVESGSNDPASYMLTMIMLSLMNNDAQPLVKTVLLQIILSVIFGVILALCASFLMRHVSIEIDGFYPLFVSAIAVLGYGLCGLTGGNGYLCVYLIGIILGNSKILHKKTLVHFFDGISWLMQIMLFFTLGLLSFPSRLPGIILPSVLVSLFLIFVARPLAVFGILKWFRVPPKHMLLISWVGLRGAASIVFAIFAVSSSTVTLNQDIFHMVFFVALFSVSVQGTLIPWVAKKLDLVGEEESSVFKTFTDYEEYNHHRLLELTIDAEHPWNGKSIMEAEIPAEILIVMIQRKGKIIVPKGSTVLRKDDVLVLSGDTPELLHSQTEM